MCRPFVALLVAVLLAGCASHALEQRQAYLQTLVGRSEADVVRALGVPTRTFEAGGVRFLAYDQSRLQVIPGYAPWGWGWGWGYATPPEVYQLTCETTFEILQGKVASFTLRGNACG